jgi:hypothetical protein
VHKARLSLAEVIAESSAIGEGIESRIAGHNEGVGKVEVESACAKIPPVIEPALKTSAEL